MCFSHCCEYKLCIYKRLTCTRRKYFWKQSQSDISYQSENMFLVTYRHSSRKLYFQNFLLMITVNLFTVVVSIIIVAPCSWTLSVPLICSTSHKTWVYSCLWKDHREDVHKNLKMTIPQKMLPRILRIWEYSPVYLYTMKNNMNFLVANILNQWIYEWGSLFN